MRKIEVACGMLLALSFWGALYIACTMDARDRRKYAPLNYRVELSGATVPGWLGNGCLSGMLLILTTLLCFAGLDFLLYDVAQLIFAVATTRL